MDEERINQWLSEILTESQPFPGDGPAIDPTYEEGDPRFVVERAKLGLVAIYDRLQGFDSHLHFSVIQSPEFSVARWYAERCVFNSGMPKPWHVAQRWFDRRFRQHLPNFEDTVELGGVQVDRNKYLALQQNAAQVKGNHRVLPKPIMLNTPLSLQLAVQGSRSKVNTRASVRLDYQDISETHTFDIININNYDVILGTSFMYQHQICLGFNPARGVVGSDTTLAINSRVDAKLMSAGIMLRMYKTRHTHYASAAGVLTNLTLTLT